MTSDQILATFMVCVFVFAIWCAIEHHQRNLPPKRYGFVSCYRAPLRDTTEYLCRIPLEESGYWYSPNIANAHVFETYAEAKAPTPVYDGSDGIEQRAWVMKVEL